MLFLKDIDQLVEYKKFKLEIIIIVLKFDFCLRLCVVIIGESPFQ